MNLDQLRREMKSRRSALSSQEWSTLSQKIAQRILSQTWFQSKQHLAFYMPVQGEVDTQPLLDHAWERKKNCYLPVLHPLEHNSLWFAAYHPQQVLVKNRYGILEPKLDTDTQIIPAWALEVVFLPMIAFDAQCHRLGTGGGYYDRTFAFVNKASKPHPHLVGLAYEFQKIDALHPQPWDVDVNHVVTESYVYKSPFSPFTFC